MKVSGVNGNVIMSGGRMTTLTMKPARRFYAITSTPRSVSTN